MTIVLPFALAAACAGAEPSGQAEGARPSPSPSPSPSVAAERAGKRQRVVSALPGFDLLEAQRARTQAMLVGGTRPPAVPVPLAPRLGRAFDARPSFAWEPPAGGSGDAFVVVVLDDALEELARIPVRALRVAYPKDAAPLEPGRTYMWTVESPGAVPCAPSAFSIIGGDERARIQAKLDAAAQAAEDDRENARARVFVEHRVWYDAVETLTRAIETLGPSRARLEARATVYAQLEATRALSERDFERAEGPGDRR
ncbi:MAG: DUF928 domain-containing protein [Vicinamibacteria bacterium]